MPYAAVFVQAKIGSDPEQYVAAPAGVQFHEVTAGGLVKVNSSGSLTDTASMALAPTKATFGLAMAMHAARTDVKSVVFLCNPSSVSVSDYSLILDDLTALKKIQENHFEYLGKLEAEDSLVSH